MLKGRAYDNGGVCGREEVCAGLSPLVAMVRRDVSILDDALVAEFGATCANPSSNGHDRGRGGRYENQEGWLLRLSKEIFRRRQSS